MAIPDKPLKVKAFDPKELTLDESALFTGGEIDKTLITEVVRDFLIKYTEGWTRREIGRLTFADFEQLAPELGAQLRGVLVPKAP